MITPDYDPDHDPIEDEIERMSTTTAHNYRPLKIATGAAGEITIVCMATGDHAQWNNAVTSGWVADLNGAAFKAYYSPRGLAIKERAEP